MDLNSILAWLYQLDLSLKIAIGLAFVLIINSINKANSIDTSPNGLLAWKKQRELSLYHTTRYQAYALEFAIVALGIWTAINTDRTITVTSVFVIVIALTELCKLAVTESASRYPSFLMIMLCFLALMVSAGFSGETIYRITDTVAKEHSIEVSKKQDSVEKNNKAIIGHQNTIKDLRNQKSELNQSIRNSALVELNQEEVSLIKKDIENLEYQKKEAINSNNSLEKINIRRRIEDLEGYITEIDKAILEYKNIYRESLESLRSAKFHEVEAARRTYIRTNIRENYDLKILDLSEKSAIELKKLTDERDRLKELIDKENFKLDKLLPLNESTQLLIQSIDLNIKDSNKKIDELTRNKKELILKNDQDQQNLLSRITQEEQQINVLLERNRNTLNEINEAKTENMFYSMAALFFQKEASAVSESELKEFLYYFVIISAVGLALMPVLLFSISIQIEKRITEEAQNIKLKEFLLQVLNSLKLSLKYISDGARTSLEILKEKRTERIKRNTKIAEARAKAQALEHVSSHEQITQENDKFQQDMLSRHSNVLEHLQNIEKNIKEAIIESIKPKIELMVSEQVAEKEINSVSTQNFISKSFLADLFSKKGQQS